MSVLADSWTTLKLGELFAAERRGIEPAQYPAQEFELWSVPAFPSGAPEIVRGKDVGSNKQRVSPGDVLLCKINPRINRVWVVGQERGREQIASTEWIVLRGTRVDPHFLAHQLREASFRERLCAEVSGVGGSLTRARPQVVAELEVVVAPLAEQRRIVAKLDELLASSRAVRAALDAVPALLERYRQAVLAAAFRGQLTANWRAEHTQSAQDADVVLRGVEAARRHEWSATRASGLYPATDNANERPSELPPTWRWASLEQLTSAVSSICYGVVQPGDDVPGGIPLVRVCDVEGGQVRASALRTIAREVDNQHPRSRLRGGEVLVTVVGTIGRVAVAPPSIAGANIARAVARLCPVTPVTPAWIAYALGTPEAQAALTRESREVARKTLNVGSLAQVLVPVAPVDEMREIIRCVALHLASHERQLAAVLAARRQLDQVEQAALGKAFRGELVPPDPADEPASALLAHLHGERATVLPPRMRCAPARA